METVSASCPLQLQNQKGEITCCTTWSAVWKAIEESSLWQALSKNEQSAEAQGASSYKAPVPNGKVSAALINLRSRISPAEAQIPQTRSLDAKGTDQADKEASTSSVLGKMRVYLSPQKEADSQDAAIVAPEESTASQGMASSALTKMRMYLTPGGESKVATQDQFECHVNGSGPASQSQVAQAGTTSSVLASVRTMLTPRKEQDATAKEFEDEVDENTSVNENGEVSTSSRASAALLKMRMAQDSVMDKMRMWAGKKDEQESTAGADTDSNTAATNETSTAMETGAQDADALAFGESPAESRKSAMKSAAIGAGGGAVALGAGGGAVGAAAGVPLALVTFGLSVPVGAAIGTAVGGTAGAIGGGAAGYAAKRIRSRSRSAERKAGELPG